MATPKILVIGAGVSGLTTALCLAEAGKVVEVIAQLPPKETTSAVAGASWGPYMVEDPRVLHWSGVTRRELERIAVDPASGVRLVNGLEAADEPMEPPGWAVEVQDYRECTPDELPDGYASGWRYTIPLVDMPSYLDHLTGRLDQLGIKLQAGVVSRFEDLTDRAGVIVNCTGLGSRTLVPDASLFATRGQLVVVENPGIDWFFQDNTHDAELTYFLPHGDHVVLGGSAVEQDRTTVPDPEVQRRIIDRCAAIEPRLGDARVIGSRVGLRPTRPEVRVERVDLDGVPLVHNYGHGGAGLTLSWGCARHVLELLDS